MFSKSKAIKSFQEHVGAWQRSSLALVTSGAVVMLVATHGRTEDRRTFNETVEDLHDAIADRGLGKSMAYRYLGLAKGLAQKLITAHPLLDGIVGDVLGQRGPNAAEHMLTEHLVTEGVKSLDSLADWVGGSYRRSLPDNAGRGATDVAAHTRGGASTPPSNGNGDEAEALSPTEMAQAIASVPDPVNVFREIISRIEDIDILSAMIRAAEQRIAKLTARKTGLRKQLGESVGKAPRKTPRPKRRDDAPVHILG